MRRPHWRKMTWVLILWTVLMAIWIVAGAATVDPANECAGEEFRGACEAGTEAGEAIGIGALVVLWFFGFMVLSLIWFMTRPKGRECPACGERVKRGFTACPACGHDFAAAAATPAPSPPPP